MIESNRPPELYAGLVHACRYCGLYDQAIATKGGKQNQIFARALDYLRAVGRFARSKWNTRARQKHAWVEEVAGDSVYAA